ncbi:MAG: DUF1501 domain-containing protein [Geodermatophilaceae bacterium]|nr:DUF1501 domain-containing protein [Geodermatophilaceae bacterium]
MTGPTEHDLVTAADQVAAAAAHRSELWRGGFTRRRFLAGAGMVAAAALGSQLVTTRRSYAAPGTATGRALVVIFLRGGFDGLAAVVPAGDPDYLIARPSIGVPAEALLPLDRRFGLHPALGALAPFFAAGQLGIVHAVGGGSGITRSHFQAQDQIERGVDSPSTRTGWLERALDLSGPGTTFRAVSEGISSPASLAGSTTAVSLQGVDSVLLNRSSERMTTALRGLFSGLDLPVAEQVGLTLSLLAQTQSLRATPYTPAEGVRYPAGNLGAAMSDLARLIKADVGLRAATVDVGGWDLHSNAGQVDNGDMTAHLAGLGSALAAFATDLGDRLADTTVVTMSEFGRRVAENGSGGTDHGGGNAMFLLGGGVAGGVVHGSWPGLAPAALVDGDLAGVNDYRDVVAEVARAQLGIGSVDTVFPGHRYTALGVVR